MKFFNTEGPVESSEHYLIPPLERLDRSAVLRLIGRKRYFVLHAPRQTGKTSALVALRDELNSSGCHRAAYINVEPAQVARDNIRSGMRAILSVLGEEAEINLNDMFVRNNWQGILESAGELGVFSPGIESLVSGGPASPGSDDRRDRCTVRRSADLGTPSTTGGLSTAS